MITRNIARNGGDVLADHYDKTPTAEAKSDAPSADAVCGRNAVRELIKSGRPVDKILVQKGEREGSIRLVVAEAIAAGITVVEADRRKIEAYGANAQGVCALIPEREYAQLEDIFAEAAKKGEPPFIVLCDHIEDPHNFGAVIRSACCAGAHGVIIPKRGSATLNSTAVKASAGASEHIPVCRVSNIAQTVDELKKKNVWVYAAEAGGADYRKTDFTGALALVFGSEGDGVSRIVKDKCDGVISIPMYGEINSLNVSAAAAVVLFAAASQRHNGG